MDTSTLVDRQTAERLAVAELRARATYSREGLASQADYTVGAMVRYYAGGVEPGTSFYADFDREQNGHYVVVAREQAERELRRRANEAGWAAHLTPRGD